MSIDFDPFSFVAAIVAVAMAFIALRRDHQVLVRISKCEFSTIQSVLENNSEFFDKLSIRIRNVGVALHDIQMSLEFISPDGHSRFTCVLDPLRQNKGEFARGMEAEFGFRSYRLTNGGELLRLLTDVRKQEVTLNVYSRGFLAFTFNVYGVCDSAKISLNRFINSINRSFWSKRRRHKETMLVYREVISPFPTIGDHLTEFVGRLHRVLLVDQKKAA